MQTKCAKWIQDMVQRVMNDEKLRNTGSSVGMQTGIQKGR